MDKQHALHIYNSLKHQVYTYPRLASQYTAFQQLIKQNH